MNGAHWHLVLNHLPIILPMVGLFMMIGGLSLKSEILKRAAYSIFILGALGALAAFSTGEGAEEIVEGIKGIDENFIKVHEETAEIFSIVLYVMGGISLLGLWASWKRKSFSNPIVLVTIVLALVSFYYAKQVGTTGGEIRHTEIRVDGLNTNQNVNQNNGLESEDDD